MTSRLHRSRFSAAAIAALFSVLIPAGCAQFGAPVEAQKTEPPLQYLGAWGAPGKQPGQLSDPDGIATDKHGNVFIADPGSDFIDKFDPDGKPLLCFQQDGLRHPQWITVDSGGAIYVTDPSRNSVFIFLPDGKRFRTLRLRTRPQPENVVSVAVYGDGLIYILDRDASRVFVYTPRMRLVRSWFLPGSTRGARGRRGPLALGEDGDVYIADTDENRIQRISPEGRLVSEIPGSAAGSTAAFSSSFALSGRNLLVMDANGRTLHVLSTEGALKLNADFGPELTPSGHAVPEIAVSPQHEMFVAGPDIARVLHYRMNF